MKRHAIAAVLLVALALPVLGATISDEMTAARDLIKADKLLDAEGHLFAAVNLASAAGLDKVSAADLMLLADAHRLLMALSCDRAIKSGTLTEEQVKAAKKTRREVLGVKNMKAIGHGEEIDLKAALVPGKTNIVDFYSVYCGPCMQFAPYLEALADARDDIFLIKVDINRPGTKGIDWASPTAKQFGLQSIPHIKLYGPDGNLQAEGNDARTKVIQMIQAAGAG